MANEKRVLKDKVLYRLPRKLVDNETGEVVRTLKFEKNYCFSNNDFHSNKGTIKQQNLAKNGLFEMNKDIFVVHDVTDLDLYKQIKRKAQIITLKDIGPIIAYTGINRDSLVIDAGVGSGSVTCFLSKIVKEIHAFDVNEENIFVSKENVDGLGLKNVKIEKKSVYEPDGFNENFYDVFVLDVPEPSRALKTASKVLKVGGFLVIYAPNINQIHQAVMALPENLLLENTLEVIERDWSVKEKILRPVTKDFGHTAFLCFIRKIKT